MLGQGVFHSVIRRRTARLIALLALIVATVVMASPDYSGCQSCHGDFNGAPYTSLHDASPWGGSLMDVHVNWVDGRCTACHLTQGPGPVYLADSGDALLTNGCVGCHGRENDVTGTCTNLDTNANARQHCGSGAGLRLRHENAVGQGTCSNCHVSDPSPAGEHVLPWNYPIAVSAVKNACNNDGSEARFGLTGLDNDGDGQRDEDDADCQFPVTAGLNDAWFDPNTSGQGFLIVVLADTVFLAWFTYDVNQPPMDATAVVGHPGHRWLTAQGPFEGDTAVLDINLSSGGQFDSANPPVGPPTRVGELTLQWSDCRNATLSYQMDGVGSNVVAIRRISQANIPLCEMLVQAASEN